MNYRDVREERELARIAKTRKLSNTTTSQEKTIILHRNTANIFTSDHIIRETLNEYRKVAIESAHVADELNNFYSGLTKTVNYNRIGHENNKYDLSDIIVKREELLIKSTDLIDKVIQYDEVISKLPISARDKYYLSMVYVFGKDPISNSKTKRIIDVLVKKGCVLPLL